MKNSLNPFNNNSFRFSVLIAIFAITAPVAVRAQEKQHSVSVRTLKGSAYFSEPPSGWQPLKEGKLLSPGAVIRTGASSIVSYDLFFSENNYVLRVKSQTTASLARLEPAPPSATETASSKKDLPPGHVAGDSGAALASQNFTQFDISTRGAIRVNTGTLNISYVNPTNNKPDHVTLEAGQSFTPPASAGAVAPSAGVPPGNQPLSKLERVFEIIVKSSASDSPADLRRTDVPRAIEVRVPVVSP